MENLPFGVEAMETAVLRRAAVGIAVALLSVSAWSADPAPPVASPSAAVPSKEVREKMAMLHEQMAACLRSDKSFAECRAQMRRSCPQTVGAESCPLMGMGRGPGRGRMMQPPPASAPK